MNYIARWAGWKPAETPKSREQERRLTQREAAKMNRAVDISAFKKKKLSEMPLHVQEATRATLARMREHSNAR